MNTKEMVKTLKKVVEAIEEDLVFPCVEALAEEIVHYIEERVRDELRSELGVRHVEYDGPDTAYYGESIIFEGKEWDRAVLIKDERLGKLILEREGERKELPLYICGEDFTLEVRTWSKSFSSPWPNEGKDWYYIVETIDGELKFLSFRFKRIAEALNIVVQYLKP